MIKLSFLLCSGPEILLLDIARIRAEKLTQEEQAKRKEFLEKNRDVILKTNLEILAINFEFFAD